eukprot:TRINITY_DN264_c0_g1_i1.p3 TRINITY_DN264_c0_g1~~TRINITY_DN264_c0_g1_i1.p3  ORF type:complete len:241 (-),score=67.59 TRINITY_DN264_c0_g1_i1:43-735(-)
MRASLFGGVLCALLAPANAQFAADLSDRAALDALAQAEAEQVDVMLQLNRGMPGVYTPPPSLTRTAINARSDATPDVPTDPITHLPVAQVPGTAVPWSESALPSESRESREHADPAGDLDELQRGGSRLRFGDVIGAGMAEAGEVPQPGTRMPRVPAAERQGQDAMPGIGASDGSSFGASVVAARHCAEQCGTECLDPWLQRAPRACVRACTRKCLNSKPAKEAIKSASK